FHSPKPKNFGRSPHKEFAEPHQRTPDETDRTVAPSARRFEQRALCFVRRPVCCRPRGGAFPWSPASQRKPRRSEDSPTLQSKENAVHPAESVASDERSEGQNDLWV